MGQYWIKYKLSVLDPIYTLDQVEFQLSSPLYCILRNPLREVSSSGKWSICLPLHSIHGEVYRYVDIQVRYINKE